MDILRHPGGTPPDHSTAASDAVDWPVIETLQSTLLALSLAACGIVPRAVPLLVCALAVLTYLEAARLGLLRAVLQDMARSGPVLAGLALLAWALLSSLWASDRGFALRSVGQVGAVLLAGAFTTMAFARQFDRLSPIRRRRFVRAVAFGFLVGLAFVGMEFATGYAASLAVFGRFPTLMSDNAKDFIRDGDKVIGLERFYLDRNVALLTLALPAVWVGMRRWLSERSAGVALALTMAAAAIIIAVSSSGAAKVAALCGIAGAIAAWRWPARCHLVLSGLLVTGVVLALPIARVPVLLGLDKTGRLPPSAVERVLIWDRTATTVARSPLIGIGAQSTRFQETSGNLSVEGVKGLRRELGWHAHNAVLQTWLELGAVGAGLLLWLLLALASVCRHADGRLELVLTSLFVMVLAIAATGWGMWQPWLAGGMAAALVAAAAAMAVAGARRVDSR